jgi:hypothetical protein
MTMTLNLCKLALVPIAAALAAAVPALAADPSGGKVSKDAPKVTWTGAAPGYGYFPLHGIAQDENCQAPSCDPFTLEVVDSADLTLVATNTGATPNVGGDFIEIDVVKPDGTIIYTSSEEDKAATVKIKAAPKGSYEVRVISNDDAAAGGEYEASASLNTGAAPSGGAAAPVPGATPAPSASPAPSSGAPAATLSLRTKKASARKSRKSLKLSVSTTRPVTGLTAALRKGSKVLATGRLAKLDGAGTVTLKVKRALKAGSYTVALTANDGSRKVGLTAKIKITK